MRLSVISTIVWLAVTPAFASGGLSCEGDDANAKFLVESGVTTGMGGPVFNFRGELEILNSGVAEDLRRTAFEPQNLPQYWLDGKELRLLVYRERPNEKPHGYVELTILTTNKEEGLYEGRYEVKVFDTADESKAEPQSYAAEGAVSCFVE